MEYSLSQKRSINFLVFIVPFLLGLGVDLYVPSLPAITNYFHTQASFVQLTISLYMLGYGIGQTILGVLSDSFGRRKVLLLSALFFTLVSFLAIFSSNVFMLEMCRFLQGISVAGLAVVARAIIVDVFSGAELAKATNSLTLSWSLGPIIAPFIGGYLQHYFDWQASFYLFGLYGLFIFVYAFTKLPETNLHLVELSFSKTYNSIRLIGAHPVFMLLTTVSGFCYAIVVLFNVVGPFLIQTVLKYSVIDYGNLALVLGCAYFLGALSNRFASNYFKSKTLLLFGLLSAFTSSILMMLLGFTFGINLYVVLIPTFLIFFFIGFIVPNALVQTMTLFSKTAGTASSIFGTLTGIIVFFVTIFGSSLKTDSQIPLSFIYLVLLLLSMILFLFTRNVESEK
ncbi:MAG: drug resistance transporter, Bcr/CflA subfamily [Massilibacillus sp.]|jgi:Bcr/CflA subfamily drug resistance transporter|nr:drug resistance transporter, Bcr/CflA subfamily [Massilibacillus sp.]